MAKTKEELKELKQKYDSLQNELKQLTEDELKQVTGGYSDTPDDDPGPRPIIDNGTGYTK